MDRLDCVVTVHGRELCPHVTQMVVHRAVADMDVGAVDGINQLWPCHNVVGAFHELNDQFHLARGQSCRRITHLAEVPIWIELECVALHRGGGYCISARTFQDPPNPRNDFAGEKGFDT